MSPLERPKRDLRFEANVCEEWMNSEKETRWPVAESMRAVTESDQGELRRRERA